MGDALVAERGRRSAALAGGEGGGGGGEGEAAGAHAAHGGAQPRGHRLNKKRSWKGWNSRSRSWDGTWEVVAREARRVRRLWRERHRGRVIWAMTMERRPTMPTSVMITPSLPPAQPLTLSHRWGWVIGLVRPFATHRMLPVIPNVANSITKNVSFVVMLVF